MADVRVTAHIPIRLIASMPVCLPQNLYCKTISNTLASSVLA